MPSLNFKPQFKPALLDGSKAGTVRERRKEPIHSGDILYLFTGMRTSHCERITTRFCKLVLPIVISTSRGKRAIKIGGVELYQQMAHWFARRDGFNNQEDFFTFFNNQYGAVFKGDWIVWDKSSADLVFDYIIKIKSSDLQISKSSN